MPNTKTLIEIIDTSWHKQVPDESFAKLILGFIGWAYAEHGDPALFSDEEFGKYFAIYCKKVKHNEI